MKFYIIFICLTFLSANSISNQESERVALTLIDEFGSSDHEISGYYSISDNDKNLIYVFSFFPKGFALISADNRAYPILGYSFENDFLIDNAPSNFNWFFNNYINQIKKIIDEDLEQNEEIRINWEKYLTSNISRDNNQRNVSPLLDSEFDQSGAWNNALSEFGFYGPVGCVAVSMSQIMHYWEYPVQGEGTNTYQENDYGTLSIDFSTAFYDYDNMAPTYATSASQQLLYHTGVSVNMNYDNSGSGAAVAGSYPSAEYSFENFFKYNEYILARYKEDYTDSEFRSILKNELDFNRPILYSGYEDDDYNGGHAWNIDGYQGNNFHCNWGWGGWNNGYFNINTMGGFPSYQTALINVVPESFMNPIALFEYEVDDMMVSFFDLSEVVNESDIAFWNWNYGNGVSETLSSSFNEYVYPESGEYTVMLSVTNIYGQQGPPHLETVIIEGLLSGDINSDELLNVLDIVILVNFIVGTDSPSNSEQTAADINDDNVLNVLDIVQLVNLVLN